MSKKGAVAAITAVAAVLALAASRAQAAASGPRRSPGEVIDDLLNGGGSVDFSGVDFSGLADSLSGLFGVSAPAPGADPGNYGSPADLQRIAPLRDEIEVSPAGRLPRGIRNNNPGNIEHGDNWLGLAGEQSDERFVTFKEPEYGIRAMSKIFDSYARRGVDTVREIIGTWAPAGENDVDAYVASVARRSGLRPGQKITTDGERAALIEAMIHHENGAQPYAMAVIEAGIRLAKGG